MTHVLTLSQEAMRKFFLPEQASEIAKDSDNLFMFITWISIISFVGLMGVMGYFVVRYRKREGVATQRSVAHNTPLELAWSIGPLLILVVVFFWGFAGYQKMIEVDSDAEVIRVQGSKWTWAAQYKNGGEPTEQRDTELGTIKDGVVADLPALLIKVPENRAVNVELVSNDVIHSFWVPAFRIKRDVFPNRRTAVTFKTLDAKRVEVLDEAGNPKVEDGKPVIEWQKYPIYCAEYCGNDHSRMMAWIQIVPQEEYEAELHASLNTGIDQFKSYEEFGEYLYNRQCITCHSVDGSPNTGPTWEGLYGKNRNFTDGTSGVADDDYIRASMLYPGEHVVAGFSNQMPSFANFDEDKLLGIIAYIKSLSPDAATEDDSETPE